MTTLGDSSALVHALHRALQARARQPVTLIETHISWVLLAGDLAYKLKKPVRLPFVDYGTPAARHHFCEEEVRLNRRLARPLYLGVSRITGTPQAPALDGDGPVLDHAVRMRRFPPGALFAERLAAGTLGAAEIDKLAALLADFHERAPRAEVASGFGSAQARHAAAINALAGLPPRPESSRLRTWLETSALELAPLWTHRQSAGHVRECHGDLHLANVLLHGGEVAAFDGIEFDPALRWIDVIDDIAFPAMDLLAHGRRDLAFRFVNAWLDRSGDHAGLPAPRFSMVYRALVRAQVAALRERQGIGDAAPRYFDTALALARESDPRLLVTHGLPGSGKTWVSQQLLERVGAIRLRSDVERKRLAGLAALDDSQARGMDLYGEAATERTYAQLLATARVAVRAGYPTIIDAAFLRRAERAGAAALARELNVPFAILDCRADLPLLHERLAARQARRDDASEADIAVLERLRDARDALNTEEHAQAIVADAAQPPDITAIAATWLARR